MTNGQFELPSVYRGTFWITSQHKSRAGVCSVKERLEPDWLIGGSILSVSIGYLHIYLCLVSKRKNIQSSDF